MTFPKLDPFLLGKTNKINLLQALLVHSGF